MITAPRTGTSNLKADYNLGYIWLISVVAALGGLLFGWDWVVIGGAKPFFEPFFNLGAIAQQWSQHALARMLGLNDTQEGVLNPSAAVFTE